MPHKSLMLHDSQKIIFCHNFRFFSNMVQEGFWKFFTFEVHSYKFPLDLKLHLILVLYAQIKPHPTSWQYPVIKLWCQHWFLPKDNSVTYQHQPRRKNWCKRAIFSQESENSVKNKNVESCRVNSWLLSLSHMWFLVCTMYVIYRLLRLFAYIIFW